MLLSKLFLVISKRIYINVLFQLLSLVILHIYTTLTHTHFTFSVIHKHDSFTCTIFFLLEVDHPTKAVYTVIPCSLPAHPNILTNIPKCSSFDRHTHLLLSYPLPSAGTSLFHLSILCFFFLLYDSHLKYPNHNSSIILRAHIADRSTPDTSHHCPFP